MRMIEFNGQHVYTHALFNITKKNLQNTMPMEGTIKDIYFFVFSHDNSTGIRKVDYNSEAIDKKESGLMIDIIDTKLKSQVSTQIFGRKNINNFLADTNVSDKDLSPLKDKNATAYMHNGERILGIGIDAYVSK